MPLSKGAITRKWEPQEDAIVKAGMDLGLARAEIREELLRNGWNRTQEAVTNRVLKHRADEARRTRAAEEERAAEIVRLALHTRWV